MQGWIRNLCFSDKPRVILPRQIKHSSKRKGIGIIHTPYSRLSLRTVSCNRKAQVMDPQGREGTGGVELEMEQWFFVNNKVPLEMDTGCSSVSVERNSQVASLRCGADASVTSSSPILGPPKNSNQNETTTLHDSCLSSSPLSCSSPPTRAPRRNLSPGSRRRRRRRRW